MYDAGKIIAGLGVFAGLVTWPVWYTAGHGKLGYVPELQKPAEAKECVETTAYMRAWHMDLLNTWRDAVVRDGEHVYVAGDGKRHNMSLTGTCLRCHAEPAKFCNRCHDYTGVQPYCWDCHRQPKGKGI
jgi:hypothetical protein